MVSSSNISFNLRIPDEMVHALRRGVRRRCSPPADGRAVVNGALSVPITGGGAILPSIPPAQAAWSERRLLHPTQPDCFSVGSLQKAWNLERKR
jgi:hypothetical protein